MKIIKTEAELKAAMKYINNNSYYFKFKNYQFECDVDLEGIKLINLENCIFLKKFKIKGVFDSDVCFENIKFKDVSDFTDVEFKRKVRFHNTDFLKEVRFHNTKFRDLADFYRATFHEKTIFFKTDFFSRVVFSAATFKQNSLFTYTLIDDHLILRGTNFCKGVDLSLSLIMGSINLFGLKISNYDSIPDIFDESTYDKAVCVEGIIPHKNKRETFRILKKELQNQGNAIEALNMAAKEKDAYSEQLSSDQKQKIGSWRRRFQNQIILFLSKWSNSHGESWSKGVLFTLIIGLFFFYLSFINTEKYLFSLSFDESSWNGFKEGFNYYFEFILPTHSPQYLNDLEPEGLFKMWDFLGRVFVSIGIYQTIVAFRKYNWK